MVRRALLSALIAVTALTGLTACNGLGGTEGLDYVAGRGNLVQYPVADRGDPVSVSGTSLDGDPVDLEDYRGKVVVVNVWASWCGPCQREAPLLKSAAAQIDAVFVGIDVRDTDDNGRNYQRRHEMPYPSISDPGGETLLRFGDHSPSQATPSTAVLDEEGRVAAIFNGEVSSLTTLREVVEEVADGG